MCAGSVCACDRLDRSGYSWRADLPFVRARFQEREFEVASIKPAATPDYPSSSPLFLLRFRGYISVEGAGAWSATPL